MLRFSVAYAGALTALAALAAGIAAAIFILIVVDVTMRTLGAQPWGYTTPLVEYGLMWFTLLPAPWLVRTKGHVYIDSVTSLLSPRAKRVAAKIAALISIVCCSVFFYYSLLRFLDAISTGQIDSRGEDMPLWSMLLPMPLCFGLMAIEFGRYLFGFDTLVADRGRARESV